MAEEMNERIKVKMVAFQAPSGRIFTTAVVGIDDVGQAISEAHKDVPTDWTIYETPDSVDRKPPTENGPTEIVTSDLNQQTGTIENAPENGQAPQV